MIESKLPQIGTTIFTVMSQLAQDYKAVDLGQGFPDFEPDKKLRDMVSNAMNAGFNQYPHMAGVPALREAISQKVQALYAKRYDPLTEITITSGATEALMAAVMASCGAGDEVIVIEPCFDSYRPAIVLSGAKPVAVPMRPPTADDPKYRIDWERVQDAITPRTKALMLNSPHNPTGTIMQAEDLDALERLLSKHPLLLISDEVYEHLVFDGAAHLSLASRPMLAERTFVISSFGKTYHTTGWKIGYCCAPALLSTELRKVHQFLVFTVPSPMQVALAQYMQDPGTYTHLPDFYQNKRDVLIDLLSHTRLKTLPSAGTFFLLADYSDISYDDEETFARWLTVEHGVTGIPVAAFYEEPAAPEANHRLIRLCFAKQDSTLQAAAARLTYV